MEPPVTNWPANRFTPSIWGFESRPFLELPTPFLCAMSLDLDLRDADGRQDLPVSAFPAVVPPPLELDHEHFGALLLLHHFPCDLRRLERLGLQGDLAVLGDEQDVRELHRRPLRLAEPLYLDDLARGHPVLLPARRDNRFHRVFSLLSCRLNVPDAGSRSGLFGPLA